MATVPQKTLSWLYDVLKREYRDPNRAYSDLAQTLTRYPSFAPRTDVYTFENGVPALLVHFVGVIPVNFRGTPYRFPIALWIPHAYPYEAPIIYVTPTDDMLVRPGQHVGGDGRVYHPYLAHWRDAWDKSNIIDFLSILADVFANEPPVISKQQIGQRPPRDQPPLRPPPPRDNRHPPQSSSAGGRQSDPPPPPPPRPTTSDKAREDNPSQSRPGRYDAPPPLPSQPQTPGRPASVQHPYPQGNGDVQRPPNGLQYAPQRNSGLRQSMPPQSAYSPPAQQWQSQQSPPQNPSQPQQPFHQHAPLPVRPQAQGYNMQYPPNFTSQQPQQRPPRQPPPQAKKPPPLDLLDSPFDIPLPTTTAQSNLPAPPIPRNPEKDALLHHLSQQLTPTLHSQLHQNASALPALQSQHQALTNTLSTLQSEIPHLTTLSATLNSNINLVQSSLAQASTAVANATARAKAGDIPSVDEMLVPPSVVGKQLYDTVCEERGIEAGMWALQEGFVRGRVGSEVWARRTRELAREGFRKKWLGRKCARGMGLEGI